MMPHREPVQSQETLEVVVIAECHAFRRTPVDKAPQVLFDPVPLCWQVGKRNHVRVAWRAIPSGGKKWPDVFDRVPRPQRDLCVAETDKRVRESFQRLQISRCLLRRILGVRPAQHGSEIV
jgi:hypothetical protein